MLLPVAGETKDLKKTGGSGAGTISRMAQGPAPRAGYSVSNQSEEGCSSPAQGPFSLKHRLASCSGGSHSLCFPEMGGAPSLTQRCQRSPSGVRAPLFSPAFSVKIVRESSVSGQYRHCSLFPAPGFPPKQSYVCSQHTLATPIPVLSSWFTSSWAGSGHPGLPLQSPVY